MFGSIVGDNIIAGRIVSLVAFLCVAAGIFQAARFMGCRALHAAFASLLFMAWLIVSTDYVGMNDPQLFAHAIQIAGLLLVLRSTPNDIAAAALFALAIFVKHNLVTMPAAVGLWLLMTDRARARRFIGAGFAFLLSGLVLFRVLYGDSLLFAFDVIAQLFVPIASGQCPAMDGVGLRSYHCPEPAGVETAE